LGELPEKDASMTEDPKFQIEQLRRASRRWRVAAILAFSGLFLVVVTQTVFLNGLRDQLEDTQQVAERARNAATAARDDAAEARRVASESVLQLQAGKNAEFVVQAEEHAEFINQSEPDINNPHLFPTDQMFRNFDVEQNRR